MFSKLSVGEATMEREPEKDRERQSVAALMDINREKDHSVCVYSFIFFITLSHTHMQACPTQSSVRDKIMTGDG